MPTMPDPLGLADVAGLLGTGGQGDALRRQQQDQTEEEKRRKRMGLSPLTPAVENLFGGMSVPGAK